PVHRTSEPWHRRGLFQLELLAPGQNTGLRETCAEPDFWDRPEWPTRIVAVPRRSASGLRKIRRGADEALRTKESETAPSTSWLRILSIGRTSVGSRQD